MNYYSKLNPIHLKENSDNPYKVNLLPSLCILDFQTSQLLNYEPPRFACPTNFHDLIISLQTTRTRTRTTRTRMKTKMRMRTTTTTTTTATTTQPNKKFWNLVQTCEAVCLFICWPRLF